MKPLESWKAYLVLYFLILNFSGYSVIWYDKKKALKGQWRIPETRLFALALMGGSLGIYYGMKAFRHKTQHLSFKYGMPLLIGVNMVLFGIIFYKL
ncbi:DUF1294 domain-containing protein [Desulfitibacter alkalitolerans]|uniref:DUF1294 domain-containing protein n=1 Tax=Desulfitibacter alkalitolerans TaxID=264641 RepID=UPI001FA6E1A4